MLEPLTASEIHWSPPPIPPDFTLESSLQQLQTYREMVSVLLGQVAEQAKTIRRHTATIRQLLGAVEDLDRLESTL